VPYKPARVVCSSLAVLVLLVLALVSALPTTVSATSAPRGARALRSR
jgi:hypothetical protein